MVKFSLKLLVLVVFTGAILLGLAQWGNNIINENVSFKIGPNITQSVFGHSQPETAFNDSLIGKFANFSRSGESYFYTYSKIVNITEANPNLQTIFVEFSNNQIGSAMDDWTWGDIYLEGKYKKNAPFIRLTTLPTLLVHNPRSFIPIFLKAQKDNFKRIDSSNFYFSTDQLFGSYNYLQRDKTDSLVAVRKGAKSFNNATFELSKTNIKYLQEIVRYATAKNIEIYLIRSPQHRISSLRNNETQFQEIRKSLFPDIPFLDFSNVPMKDWQFGDFEHLNHRGAKVFSLWLNELLLNGLLQKQNPQVFIENEINDFQRHDENYFNMLYIKALDKNEREKFKLTKSVENFPFTPRLLHDSILVDKVYLYHEEFQKYIALEVNSFKEEEFEGKMLGLRGKLRKNDYSKYPTWLRENGKDILTWNSDFKHVIFQNKQYIFIPLTKRANISDFEYISIFVQDKDMYKGTLGNTIVLKEPSFKTNN